MNFPSLLPLRQQSPDSRALESRPPRPPSVLVVEFCDEVFARLKTQLDDYGFKTGRAVSGAAVASAFNRWAPDLVLLRADMPDESGWLITAKLRLAKCQQPVWLYTQFEPASPGVWQQVSGVNEVIVYGNSTEALTQHVHSQLRAWLKVCDQPAAFLKSGDAA